MALALYNLQWLICHKTQPNHIYLIYIYKEDLALNNPQGLICYKTKTNKNEYRLRNPKLTLKKRKTNIHQEEILNVYTKKKKGNS